MDNDNIDHHPSGDPGEVPLVEATKDLYRARVARLVSEFSDQPAALYRGASYSWGYVGRTAQGLDTALESLDPSIPVVVVLRQRPNCLAAVIALWGSGRCVTLMSPMSGDQAMAEEIVSLRPAAVVADTDDWARPDFAQACTDSICVQIGSGLTDLVVRHRPSGAARTRDPAPNEDAVIISTSGTTGPARRYAIGWDNLAPLRKERDPSMERGALINALPLFSIGGVTAITNTIFGGRPIALMDRLDVVEWAGLIRDHRPRRAGAPPAVLRMVLDAKIPPDWFASVKSFFTASAPLPMELADEFEAVYGIPIVQGYGATEFLGRITGWPDDLYERWGKAKRGSVGRSFSGVELRVVDRGSGNVLGPGLVGNLEVDTPWRARGIAAGWVPTNDLARIDEDGFVWILGRSDDVIIRGGFKIHLPDVEAVLMQHPALRDACVVGLPDDRLGAVPAALVVADGTDRPTEGELVEFVRRQLPGYMSPVLVLQHAFMPHNAMLKKDRGVIASLLSAERETRKDVAS